jgi:hypothetical protein
MARPPSTVTLPVTEAQIKSGSDQGMAAVILCEDDSVIYSIEAAARTSYRYKSPANQAFALEVKDPPNQNALVSLKRIDDYNLQVTMKPNKKWSGGKATLYFDPEGSVAPPPGLDPTISNGGIRA